MGLLIIRSLSSNATMLPAGGNPVILEQHPGVEYLTYSALHISYSTHVIE